MLPRHRHAVSVGEGIAGFVISDGLPVVRDEQIFPQRASVAPCVGNAASGAGQDISAVVIRKESRKLQLLDVLHFCIIRILFQKLI